MLTLTSPVAVPNINRMEVVAVEPRGKINTVYVYVEVIGVGAATPNYPGGNFVWQLAITNGVCQGIRAKSSPTSYGDRVEMFTATIATGFTDCVAQYRSGANDAAGRKNVETWLADPARALLPAGSVA